MSKNKKAVFTILLYLIFLVFAGYLYMYQYEMELKTKKYNDIAVEMKQVAESVIKNQEKENALISLSLSLNNNIKMALIQKDTSRLNFNYIINDISKYTDIDTIWIQLINTAGESFYRSWTDKTGDNLLDVRDDVTEVLQTKKRNSFISTGKFSLTFKAMTPIFDENTFVGIVESLVGFDSVIKSMNTQGYESILFVDKDYKKQLKNASEKMFMDDYFIATSNASQKILKIVKETNIEDYLKIKHFYIDEKNGFLFTKKSILSISKKSMGHFILAYPLDAIDMSFIIQERNKVLSNILILLILLLGIIYYIYTIQYKRFIQKQNDVLVDRVKEKTKTLQHIALHDSLTKLPNRIYLLKILQNDLREVKRQNQSLYLLFLDLDRFKEVNDTFGHSVGDKLLKKVSGRLKKSLREEDIVSRVSGDEFVVILKNTSRDETVSILDKIMHDIQAPFRVEHLELFTNLSIGVSHFPTDGSSAKVLLRQADTAMYKAKEEGKSNYQFYHSDMTKRVFIRQELGRDLQKALLNKEFEVYYQPKVDAYSGEVLGLESLVRWKHPEKGLLYPNEFLVLAEEIGLIIQIDEYVREASFKQMATWQNEGIDTGTLSLNISTKQLESENFLLRLQTCVINTGFNIDFLEIEVLENQIMKDIKKGIKILQSIKSLGVKISIDDFGTGYSSLSYLQKLPIDTLKIDRSFIQNLFEDQSSIEIVRTIISLAKNLDLEVVAEGVESKEQLECLLAEGCHMIQGYYFAKPLSPEDCKAFLLKKQNI